VRFWHKLKPAQKRNLIFVAIGLFIIGAALLSTTGKKREEVTGKKEVKEFKLEPKLLQRATESETSKEISVMRKTLEQVQEEIKNLKAEKETAEKRAKVPSAPLPRQEAPLPPVPSPQPAPPKPQREVIGGIEVVSQKLPEVKEEKKSPVNRLYLPPSFMEATLLSGLAAPTVEQGKSHPLPVIIRIKDLAILPNKVKANLKGCFVIAEGYGNLSDERVHLRLTTLSCVSRRGEAVIDQPVKGFVVDNDGRIGLRGKVVSRMDAAVVRAFLAGTLSGLGNVIQQAAANQSVSPLGVTQTVSSEKTAQYALGGGLAAATNELAKFYIELAKQSFPVIEVGTTRNITVVISEGTELQIKEAKTGGAQ